MNHRGSLKKNSKPTEICPACISDVAVVALYCTNVWNNYDASVNKARSEGSGSRCIFIQVLFFWFV